MALDREAVDSMYSFIENAKEKGAVALASEDKDQLKESTVTGIQMTQTLEMVLAELEEKSSTAKHALDHEASVDRQADGLRDIETYERVIDIVERGTFTNSINLYP